MKPFNGGTLSSACDLRRCQLAIYGFMGYCIVQRSAGLGRRNAVISEKRKPESGDSAMEEGRARGALPWGGWQS